jgi:chorismate mutase / prephenate dehydratase
MSLSDHRKAIDQLDARIVNLLNQRTRHALEIGALKVKGGEEIYAPHREQAVLQRVCRVNRGPITDESLRQIYREIMSSALALQKSMTVAFLGPEATYTHQAALRRFGASLRYAAQRTIADVFTEVSRNRADYGVVPVENSSEGIVTSTLDMFVDSDLKIVSQIVLPIRHCLMSRAPLRRIQKLFAHPQALAQCRGWVQTHLPEAETIETSSHARSAQLAAARRTAAAIANSLAAERYGLRIVQADIQDDSHNTTRFLVLGRQCSPPSGHDRTSLLFSIPNQVGSLDKVLAWFSKCRLNLTRIESRPSRRQSSESLIFADCDGHIQDVKVAKAIAALRDQGSFVMVLGSYPNEA